MPKYRVYIEQVNQTYVEVEAESVEQASEKGYAKWRRDYAHSRVTSVEACDEERKCGNCKFYKPVLKDSGLCTNDEIDPVGIGVGDDEVCQRWSEVESNG